MGAPGAGKSTFARKLSALTGLPVIHLDQLFWNAGWEATPSADFREKVETVMSSPGWIMDGDYGGTMDLRIPVADTIVYIDMPRWLCMWRVLSRSLKSFGAVREDMAQGCPEKFSWDFYKYTWNYLADKRPERLRQIEASGKGVILTGQREVDAYLRAL